MENKFEYLRIDGRDRLPSPWFSYPVLTEYETVAIYRNGRDYLDVLVGRQDGWVDCRRPHAGEQFRCQFRPGAQMGTVRHP